MNKFKLLIQYLFTFFLIIIINILFISNKLLKVLIGLFIIILISVPTSFLSIPIFIISDLVVKLFFRKKVPKDDFEIHSSYASIIILNFNGEKIIKQCLDSVIKAIEYSNKLHEIIVVDNGSTDNSRTIIKNEYPSVRLINLDKNIYYSGGNNVGIKAAKNDIIVLLNNDMIVEKNFLDPLLKHFNKKDLFSVSSQVFFQDVKKRREETGRTKGNFTLGTINIWHSMLTKEEKDFDTVLYGGGGAAAFNKKMILYLGGIDTIWEPFYWEDCDLSFKAWRRGWFSIVEPQSIVYHKHQATSIAVFKRNFIDLIKERNKYLFTWIHILNSSNLVIHFLLLPFWLIRNFLYLDQLNILPFILALKKIPLIFKRRVKEIKEQVYIDKKIFLYSNNLYYFREIHPEFFPNNLKYLKILYVCPYVPSNISHAGAGRLYQVIKLMHNLGYHISILCFASTEEEAKLQKYLKPFCDEVKVIIRHPLLNYRNFIKFDFINNDFYDPRFEDELLVLLNKTNFDIVHYKYYQIAPYIRPSKKVINIFSDYESPLLTLKRSTNGTSLSSVLNYLSLLRRTQKILEKVKLFINLTDVDANELKKYFPEAKPAIINTGVDMEYFFRNENIKENPTSIVFVGYFRHPPNVDAVLFFSKKIFPKILQKYPNAHFYIIGKDPTPEILELENKNTTVTGFVDDIRPYIDSAGIFIVPIRYGAGIRGKILQAWSMKKAVITTRRAAEGIKVENLKNAIIADGPEKFTNAILELIKDEQKRKKLGEEGYLTVKKYYSWDIKIKELEKQYLKL